MGTCGQYCNPETNERGLRLLEFASYNNRKVVDTCGPHKPSRRLAWHSPGGDYHNQIDYIMVKRRFQSSVNIAKTRSFPGADLVSDHNEGSRPQWCISSMIYSTDAPFWSGTLDKLVMMTFRLLLKRVKNQGSIRIRFSLEKLKDPNIAEIFRTTIGGKLAPLLALANQDTEIDALINSSNTAVTETANNTLGKHPQQKRPGLRITY